MLTALSLLASLATLPVAWSVPTWISQPSFCPGFPYGSQPVRGVNLGGWLVLEVCYNTSLHLEPRTHSLHCLDAAVGHSKLVRKYGQFRYR
jgi:hypothetical protein